MRIHATDDVQLEREPFTPELGAHVEQKQLILSRFEDAEAEEAGLWDLRRGLGRCIPATTVPIIPALHAP